MPLSSRKTNLLLEVVTLLKIGFLRGLFCLSNCWYFFSFSLLSCMVINRVGSWFELVGLPLGKLTEHTLEQFPGLKSAQSLDISFNYLFLLILSFGNLSHMTEVTFEDTINLFGYLRSLSHVPRQHLSCPIFAHWWRVSYCLFLLKNEKIAYKVYHWRVLDSTLEKVYFEKLQQTRLLHDDEVAERVEPFMSFKVQLILQGKWPNLYGNGV